MKRMTLALLAALAFAILSIGQAFADPVAEINYQGQVKVSGTWFEGTGRFKFVITNAAGNQSFWSNDGSSSGGSEPTAAVELGVQDGLYSVILGDDSLSNMTAIPSSVFSNGSNLYLRVWFDDGVIGSQMLSPDGKIVSAAYAINAGSLGGLTEEDFAKSTGDQDIYGNVSYHGDTMFNASTFRGDVWFQDQVIFHDTPTLENAPVNLYDMVNKEYVDSQLGDDIVRGEGHEGSVAYWNTDTTIRYGRFLAWDQDSYYLGIGSDSPEYAIDVHKTKVGVDLTAMRLFNADEASALSSVSLLFDIHDTNHYYSKITGLRNAVTHGGMLSFSTEERQSADDIRERMRITDQGNVGINTTSPAARLDVVDSLYVSSSAGGNGDWFCVTGGRVGIGTSNPWCALEAMADPASKIMLTTDGVIMGDNDEVSRGANIAVLNRGATGQVVIAADKDNGPALNLGGATSVLEIYALNGVDLIGGGLTADGTIRSDTGFNLNGTNGVSGTYNFYTGGSSGVVSSMTVSGGIVTSVTVTP